MTSYWKIYDKKFDSTDKVIKCINEQCDALNEITNGKVKAVFQTKRNDLFSTTQLAAKSLKKMFVNEKETKAQELIANKIYEFYITDKNNEYEFPIFSISMNKNFPIFLKVDSSLVQEIALNEEYKLNGYDEFDSLFRQIIQSTRISYIVEQLIQL